MTNTRTRRPRTHRISTRLLKSQKAAVAALAATNRISFNAQLTSMIWEIIR